MKKGRVKKDPAFFLLAPLKKPFAILMSSLKNLFY